MSKRKPNDDLQQRQLDQLDILQRHQQQQLYELAQLQQEQLQQLQQQLAIPVVQELQQQQRDREEQEGLEEIELQQQRDREELELEELPTVVAPPAAPVAAAPVVVAPITDTGRKVTQRTGCWRRGEIVEPYVIDQESVARGWAVLSNTAPLWQPEQVLDPRTKAGVKGRCYATGPHTSYTPKNELSCTHSGPCWLTSINRSVSKLAKALDPKLLKQRKVAAVEAGQCMNCQRDTVCENCDLRLANCVDFHNHLRDWQPRDTHPEYHPVCWRPTLSCDNCDYETEVRSNMRRHVKMANCNRPVCRWCKASYSHLETHLSFCTNRDVHFTRFRMENPRSTLILLKRNGQVKNSAEWVKLYNLLA